ncbi:amidase [Clostridium phage phiZP2]|uniref:N-acetylmuramoyl-L-alanine amidase n=1 Tax=Clostridium phage phiZP2 TaxID=1162306 RepID=I3PV70_9CAUD|nr:amidase [Clostridium phage phiZP2]AFH27146.1 N-acetylmuramoyl-L-alanine amidase [Clostridium phage phiZP2]
MKIIQSNIYFNGNKAGGNNPKEIIVHHSEHSTANVYDIDKWHKDKGWCGIGYHYFIDKQGNIYTGRPEDWTGAHCINHNTKSIGICLQGRLQIEKVTDAQYKALLWLIQDIRNRRGNMPVYGHKELNSTDCPGNLDLNKLRTDVNNKVVDSNGGYTENATVVNVNSYLNVRSKPSDEIIGKLFPNERIQVNWVDSNYLGWYYITYRVNETNKLKSGYVSAKYIKKD